MIADFLACVKLYLAFTAQKLLEMPGILGRPIQNPMLLG